MEWRALDVRPPFSLEATARALQRRPSNRVDTYAEGAYRRLFATSSGLALVEVENRGTVSEPDLRWTIRHGDGDKKTLEATLRKMFGLDIDPEPLERLATLEPALEPTAVALSGMRPPRFGEWYEAFANIVPFQQVSLEAGTAIAGRFIERFGHGLDFDGHRYFSYPEPAVVGDADVDALRQCGLSRTKAQTLLHTAQLIASGELREAQIDALPSKEAMTTLKTLRGVGPWTAGLVLLRGLGRLDVFPPGDIGVLHRLNAVMQREPDTPLTPIAEQFGVCRGYLYFYALGSGLLEKGLITGC